MVGKKNNHEHVGKSCLKSRTGGNLINRSRGIHVCSRQKGFTFFLYLVYHNATLRVGIEIITIGINIYSVHPRVPKKFSKPH